MPHVWRDSRAEARGDHLRREPDAGTTLRAPTASSARRQRGRDQAVDAQRPECRRRRSSRCCARPTRGSIVTAPVRADAVPELPEARLHQRLRKHGVALAQVRRLARRAEPHRPVQRVADRGLEVGTVAAVRDEEEPRRRHRERAVVGHDDLGRADERVGDDAGDPYGRRSERERAADADAAQARRRRAEQRAVARKRPHERRRGSPERLAA